MILCSGITQRTAQHKVNTTEAMTPNNTDCNNLSPGCKPSHWSQYHISSSSSHIMTTSSFPIESTQRPLASTRRTSAIPNISSHQFRLIALQLSLLTTGTVVGLCSALEGSCSIRALSEAVEVEVGDGGMVDGGDCRGRGLTSRGNRCRPCGVR
jgi:hypothetical protein